MNYSKPKHHTLLPDLFLCFVITTGILLLFLMIEGFAPFGSLSMASMDAEIQYLDLFAYFKDVLDGRNSIFYSFSKMLGGNCFAVYSYYLSSPFCLLLPLIPKQSLHSYFDICVVLKLGLAASTFRYLMADKVQNTGLSITFQRIICLFLPVCYALQSWCLSQCSNIMWLDGVYMLPLMICGIERIKENGSWVFLSVCTSLAIWFNWYSAGINCVYLIIFIIWYFFYKTEDIPSARKYFLRCFSGLFFGVLLSSVILLPTAAALRNGNRGALSFSGLTDFSLIGNIFTVVQQYHPGIAGAYGRVTLYCGILPVLACILLFFSGKITPRHKVCISVFILITVLSFYFTPLTVLFSLMKEVGSYWYRYAYAGSFTICYIASLYGFQNVDKDAPRNVMIGGTAFIVILLLSNINTPFPKGTSLVISCLITFGIVLAISLFYNVKYQKLATLILTLSLLTDVSATVYLMLKKLPVIDINAYSIYSAEASGHISRLKSYDNSFYRVTQTSTRMTDSENLSASYNEALAYSYASLATYTSSPDDNQRMFLDQAGYPINGENMNIVNTSILPLDSLLGVKYMWSAYPIRGYTDMPDSFSSFQDKRLYRNPYALPIAFSLPKMPENVPPEGDNPFLFINSLYSALLDKKTEIFKPLKFDAKKNSEIVYKLAPSAYSSFAVYGYLPVKDNFNGKVDVNDNYSTGYAKWLSPHVFYIPDTNTPAIIRVTSADGETPLLRFGAEQFYVMDMDYFSAIAEELQSRAAQRISVNNGRIRIDIESARESEVLFLSVPYDSGWKISLNNNAVQSSLFADCMYLIALLKGNNTIIMQYRPPWFLEGLALSIVGAFVLALMHFKMPRK